MLDYLAAEVPRIEDRIRSWPSTLSIGDLFTGAGTFTKVTDVAINEIQRVFGNAASHLEADFLLPTDSAVVNQEINRREVAVLKAEMRAENRKAKKETKEKDKDKDKDKDNEDDGIEKDFSKWKGVHMELAEKRSLVGVGSAGIPVGYQAQGSAGLPVGAGMQAHVTMPVYNAAPGPAAIRAIPQVSVVFAMRLSRTRATEGPRYLNTTAVFFSEVLKLLCSFVFLSHEQGNVQNNLLFISLSNLSGAVYQVTYQLKILTTAVLSVIILGKDAMCALFILFAGVALIQLPRGETKASSPSGGNAAVGLAAVLSACATSGLAGVYLEKILKQTDSSIWMRNIQLAFFGGILAYIGCYMQDGDQIRQDGFLQGYSSLVWAVIALQAVGGLVVAAVQLIEKIVEVPKVEVQEKYVDVPTTLYQEKVVEVPQVQVAEVVRQVPKIEVQEVMKEVSKPITEVYERIVEVAGQVTASAFNVEILPELVLSPVSGVLEILY
eukprot:s1213_g8.t2